MLKFLGAATKAVKGLKTRVVKIANTPLGQWRRSKDYSAEGLHCQNSHHSLPGGAVGMRLAENNRSASPPNVCACPLANCLAFVRARGRHPLPCGMNSGRSSTYEINSGRGAVRGCHPYITSMPKYQSKHYPMTTREHNPTAKISSNT